MNTSKITDLPPEVLKTDLEWPTYGVNVNKRVDRNLGNNGSLTFHRVESFGWCIATLPISKARRAGVVDRTYGIRVEDGATVRIGAGPHVSKTVTVYLRGNRAEKLKKYIELYSTGMVNSNKFRDLISTRRLMTAERRFEAGGGAWDR